MAPRRSTAVVFVVSAVCFLLGVMVASSVRPSTCIKPRPEQPQPQPLHETHAGAQAQAFSSSHLTEEGAAIAAPMRAQLPVATSGEAAPGEAAGEAGEAAGETACEAETRRHYRKYLAFSERAAELKGRHGPLRIAGFSRLWVPPLHGTGGMQFHALHLYSQLAARGHLVHVFVTGGPGDHRKLYFDVDHETLRTKELAGSAAASRASLTVHQIPSDKNGEYSEIWFENVLDAFRKLNKTLGGFHVAHSESWAGVPNAYQIGLQMAVTWHGSMLDWFRNEINLIVHNYRIKGKMTGQKTATRMNALGSSVAYEAYMLLTVPHHIVISDSAAKDLQEINLVDPKRVHMIYNGVNPRNFKPDATARAAFLSSHGVDPNLFVVGCGGRLEGIKGHHQLSKAMEVVLTRRPDSVALLVAGSGGEATRYEALKAKGLRVVMLGMLKQENLARFYQSIDVFVDPFYQHHGLNTVMIEAVLSGTPIIATHLASAQTTAPCSDFGRTFSLGDVDDLVAQIEFFCDNPEERKRVGRNVRDRAAHLFSSSIMAGSYESLLYDAWLHPVPLEPIVGKVVCRHAYPAMCYREPV